MQELGEDDLSLNHNITEIFIPIGILLSLQSPVKESLY